MEVTGVGTSIPRAQNPATQPLQRSAQVDQVRRVLEELEAKRIVRAGVTVRESIRDLQAVLKPATASGSTRSAPTAKSSSAFSLDATATATVLQSTNPINTENTDFNPTNPVWSGISNAFPTVSGLYDGAQGTGDLTFTVTDWGLRGFRDAEIQVTGPVGEFVSDITIGAFDPPSQSYDVGNGLAVTFDGNFWWGGETFTVSVDDDFNQMPDPDIAFNADPNFETGVSVVAGTFEINGETITVAADDTINTVLDKINTSNANVTATYDSGNEAIVLTHNQLGSGPTITLANDTSGFFKATKLNGAVPTPGEDPDPQSPMAQVTSLAGVSAGSLLVNNVAIAIDPATDSVDDVLAAINASAADAVARMFNQSVLVIHGTASNELTLDSNGTGFFEALNIESDTYIGRKRATNGDGAALNRVFEETRNLSRALNRLFVAPDHAPQSEALDALRGEVAGLFADSLQHFKSKGFDLGIRLDTTIKPFEMRLADTTGLRFRTILRSNYAEVYTELNGRGQNGKVGLLDELLDRLQGSVFREYARGSLIDELV